MTALFFSICHFAFAIVECATQQREAYFADIAALCADFEALAPAELPSVS
jgi:hypothetical protein